MGYGKHCFISKVGLLKESNTQNIQRYCQGQPRVSGVWVQGFLFAPMGVVKLTAPMPA